MSSLVLPKISASLHSRENMLDGDLSAAKTMQAEAEDIGKEIDASLEVARSKAAVLTNEAKESIATSRNERFTALDSDLAKQLSTADAALQKQRATALKQVQSAVDTLTPQVVDKVLGKQAAIIQKAG